MPLRGHRHSRRARHAPPPRAAIVADQPSESYCPVTAQLKPHPGYYAGLPPLQSSNAYGQSSHPVAVASVGQWKTGHNGEHTRAGSHVPPGSDNILNPLAIMPASVSASANFNYQHNQHPGSHEDCQAALTHHKRMIDTSGGGTSSTPINTGQDCSESDTFRPTTQLEVTTSVLHCSRSTESQATGSQTLHNNPNPCPHGQALLNILLHPELHRTKLPAPRHRQDMNTGTSSPIHSRQLPPAVVSPSVSSVPDNTQPRSTSFRHTPTVEAVTSVQDLVNKMAFNSTAASTDGLRTPVVTGRQALDSRPPPNKIVIPGFDPSKYGKPPTKKATAHDGVSSAPPRSASLSASIPTNVSSASGLTVDGINTGMAGQTSDRLNPEAVLRSEASTASHLCEPSFTSNLPFTPPSAIGKTVTVPSPPKAPNYPPQNSPNPSFANRNRTALAPNVAVQNSVRQAGTGPRTSQRPQHGQPIGKTPETNAEKLIRLQENELRKMGTRNRQKPTPATDTTSLKDLQLARSPLPDEVSVMLASASDNYQNISTSQDGRGGLRADADMSTSATQAIDKTETKKDRRGRVEETRENAPTPELSIPDWTFNSIQQAPHPHQLAILPVVPPSAPAPASLNTTESKNKTRNARWATPHEVRALKPVDMEIDSNAWGSDVPSNGSTADDDSTRKLQNGKRYRANAVPDAPLANWDGSWQPAPVDWNDRPRFSLDTVENENRREGWLAGQVERVDSAPHADLGACFDKIPQDTIQKFFREDLHSDGLGFVRLNAGVNAANAAQKYGYSRDVVSLAMIAEPLQDFEYLQDWGKLDLNYGENAQLQFETTNSLVTNWLAQKMRRNPSMAPQAGFEGNRNIAQALPTPAVKVPKPEVNPHAPKVNIYLRPAVRTDMNQLADLYNWYVVNSPRTTDITPISATEMRDRFDECMSAKLPFLVAVNREHKSLRRLKNNMQEKIVGFALATDFSNTDLAERITAELELYVDPQWLHKGVGKCLLDKLLDSTDRGHLANRGYSFTCDPSNLHQYSSGGGRDLNIVIFIVRHFKNPKGALENDFDTWIKKWLIEKWDFEESGCLKEVGTKFKRMLNMTYLTKKTKWNPSDGNVPDALNTS